MLATIKLLFLLEIGALFRHYCSTSIAIPVIWLLMAACMPQELSGSPELNETSHGFAASEIPSDAAMSPPSNPAREDRECPDLDSQLAQLIQLDDPAASAEKLGMKVRENKVQVLITLIDENTGVLADYDVELGTQSGNRVQAYVPFNRLCSLANAQEVLAIRPAARAIPLN